MIEKNVPERHLKILFVTAWYPTEESPSWGIFVREHAKAVELYHDVFVVHLKGRDPAMDKWWQLERTTDPLLTEHIPTYVLQHRPSPIPRTSYFIRSWALFCAFRSLLQQGFLPDVLHAHTHLAALPTVLLGRLYKIPVVITEHHSVFPRRLLKKLDLLEARIAFRMAKKVLPVSQALQRGIEDYGIQANFQRVPNVIDSQLFRPGNCNHQKRQNEKKLLCVANMPDTHVKGIPYLLEALGQLRTVRDDWHLSIIGEGPARTGYERHNHALDLDDKVKFLGSKTKPEIATLMREADVFVLPSLWDNMPCVLIEAMSSGLPIVSTKTGGIPEMVNADAGVLARPGDASSLCAALAFMLDNLEAYDPIKIAASAHQRYSYEAVGRLLDSIYRSCLNEPIY